MWIGFFGISPGTVTSLPTSQLSDQAGAVSDGEADVEVKQHSVRRAAGAYAQKSGAGKVGQVRAAAGVSPRRSGCIAGVSGGKRPPTCVRTSFRGGPGREAGFNARRVRKGGESIATARWLRWLSVRGAGGQERWLDVACEVPECWPTSRPISVGNAGNGAYRIVPVGGTPSVPEGAWSGRHKAPFIGVGGGGGACSTPQIAL